jgi:hypothetical protein
VDRHDGELDLLLKRIEELEDDLRVVIRFAKPNAVAQAAQYARQKGSQSSWANPPADDAAFQDQCRRFKEKYGDLEAF